MATKGRPVTGIPRKGIVKKGETFSRATFGITVSGLDDLILRLQMYMAKIADPLPGIMQIVTAFSIMEKQRFTSGGRAPEFGITQSWQPIEDATAVERFSKGANDGGEPLFAFGYLAKAASSPQVTPVGQKAVDLAINVLKAGAPADYSHMNNYGIFHQEGMAPNPERQWITITPEFRALAVRILRDYILELPDDIAAVGNRADKAEVQVRRQIVSGKRALGHRKDSWKMASKEPTNYNDFGTWHSLNRSMDPTGFDATYGEMRTASSHNEALARAQNWERTGASIDAESAQRHMAYLQAYKKYRDTPVHLRKQ